MYKQGDKVRIKDDYYYIEPEISNPGDLEEMHEWAGKEVTITKPYEFCKTGFLFRVAENPYIWHSDWLEEMNNFEIESDDILKLING